jgi:dTDP-4-dehydrorhamnose 3,5-epimerase
MPFKSFRRLEIPDIVLVEFIKFPDERGFFAELYKRSNFITNDIPHDFAQVNLSFSKRGVVRGLHYQVSLST